jgi:hypothetical protein
MSTVESFRRDGDSDHATLTRALESSDDTLTLEPGRTYLTPGALVSYRAGRTLVGLNARVLQTGAGRRGLIRHDARGCRFIGGEWSGLEGYEDPYAEAVLGVHGDGGHIYGVTVRGGGTGIKVGRNASDVTIERATVITAGMYGIYAECTSIDAYRNRIIASRVNMQRAGVAGQGILMTGGNSPYRQRRFEIADTYVWGPSRPDLGDQAICIGVRGHDGTVARCRTWGGSMGFSEGGDNLILSDFHAYDLAGRVRWGAEISGRNATVIDLRVRGGAIGVSCSFPNNDDLRIIGGSIEVDDIGIQLQAARGGTSRRAQITGTTIRAHTGFLGTRDVSGARLHRVRMNGTRASSCLVALDTPPAAADVAVDRCTLIDVPKLGSVYSVDTLDVSGCVARDNLLVRSGGDWTYSGRAHPV